MADGLGFGGIDLSGIDWYPDVKSRMAMPGMRSAAKLQEQVQEAAQAAYEQDWEWRDRQTELLERIIAEQERQADAAKGGKAREVMAIVLAALTLIATVAFGIVANLPSA